METMNYKIAKEELDNILMEIESGEVDIDTLSEKIKRAKSLLLFCKTKLRETEEEIENIFKTFEQFEVKPDKTTEFNE
jgi:exodeoxyribonuclease VII small subunit